MEIVVSSTGLIRAEIHVPGDKSISHRAAMLAAIAEGPCHIQNYLMGEDCLGTLEILRGLGVKIETVGTGSYRVYGCGGHFQAPTTDLDCGNSGTTMRLMSGLLAAQPFRTRMIGDASLSRRPMRRIMAPLQEMGAQFFTENPGDCPPLVIEGTAHLRGIEYRLPMASAQVKSAVLLAGLFAQGTTTVVEPAPTRDHTERLLAYFGVPVTKDGLRVSVVGGHLPRACDFVVPGDISSAAFWLVAASAQRDSQLIVHDVGLNPTRTGLLEVLKRMGAQLHVEASAGDAAEPRGTVKVAGVELTGTTIGGLEIPNVIDELPILAVAGALARGVTIIKDAAELRVKESDRLAVVAHHLQAMGADVTEQADGLEIRGGHPLHGARLDSHGDHRIAMAFAIAGLFATGETILENTACVETSYPGFVPQLKNLTHG